MTVRNITVDHVEPVLKLVNKLTKGDAPIAVSLLLVSAALIACRSEAFDRPDFIRLSDEVYERVAHLLERCDAENAADAENEAPHE